MKINDHLPTKDKSYNFDIPEDLLAAINYAFAVGSVSGMTATATDKELTGKEILGWFKSDCKGVKYRDGHILMLKQAYHAGWQSALMSRGIYFISGKEYRHSDHVA
jgi:hypothetical protein